MGVSRQINIEIDKLTHSIENTFTGDSFKTEILKLSPKNIKTLKKTDWLFDWQAETKQEDKSALNLL